jgi:hypothetical protein
VRQSRNKYQAKAFALENEVKTLKLDAALAKTNEDTLNDQILQLREAAVIVHNELATERIAMFELSKDYEELNETVLAMKSSLGSLADQWGVGPTSNHLSNKAAPPTPVARVKSSSSNPSMSVSNKDNIQATPVAPSRHPESSMSSSSNNSIQRNPITPSRRQPSMSGSNKNIQGTPVAQSRQQPSISENNNSNNSTSNRKRSNPRPPTDREKAHINLDKLPLQLIQDFNEAWKKAGTMVPPEGFHLVGPVSTNSVQDFPS